VSLFSEIGYEQLQCRVRSGQAVFFFGAGMSIDGEGNTAARLLNRLYLRFRALTSYCIRRDVGRERAVRLRKDFVQSFQIPRTRLSKIRGEERAGNGTRPIERKRAAEFYQWKILDILGERYYDFNDWVCAAFEGLLCELATVKSDPNFYQKIAEWEGKAMARWYSKDEVPLGKICETLFELVVKTRDIPEMLAGKALFLDTMGFRNCPEMMGGLPREDVLDAVLKSYRDKLQERHFVTARFAREGWTPLVMTTNFDRLLEGAFRLSGFRRVDEGGDLPPVPVPVWATVNEAQKFFELAGQNRTALVVKIHGCAEEYEILREDKGCDDWLAYLKSMVFTYREIQNWREDAWSRDFLRTLLRTRAMVFCGYSTRDPVIHDTLRSVYEEMSKSNGTRKASRGGVNEAPAFFMAGGSDDRDFHGVEVLRAASTAVTGLPVSRSATHPNYLRHQFRAPSRRKARLPDTDDVFLWTYHLAYREFQAECLRQELRGMASLLVREPVDEVGIDLIIQAFDKLVKNERDKVELLSGDSRSQEKFRRIVGWTYGFHPRLLREFACTEAMRMGKKQRKWLLEMRKLPDYYFPASARPAWTAWGAVVELAIRQAAKRAGYSCRVGKSSRPNLLFYPVGEQGRLARELLIHHQGISKRGAPPRARGATLFQTIWEIGAADYPWPKEGSKIRPRDGQQFHRPFHRARGAAPFATTLWAWATGGVEFPLPDDEQKWLGIHSLTPLG